MIEKQNSLLIILRSMINHRKTIIINVFIVSALALMLSFLMPKWYRATVVILPPEKSESLSDLAISMGLQSLAMGGGFALPVMASQSDLIASIAESRTVALRVVDSLNLMEFFETENRDKAIKALKSNLNVHVTAEGLIEISFMSKNQDRVAEVANAVAAELDYINRFHKTQKARDLKMFVEEELAKNDSALTDAEQELQEFQRVHNAIALDDQTSASIRAAAELYSQMTMDQINVRVLEKSHAANHPDVIALKNRISEIENELSQIQNGLADPNDSSTAFLAIPFSELPELTLRFLKLMRELKKEEALHEVLATQHEQAKLMEAKDTPTISVLDQAVRPMYKFKPKKAFIVIVGFLLSLVFSVIYATLIDRWTEFKSSDPEKYRDISSLLSVLKNDLLGFKKTKAN